MALTLNGTSGIEGAGIGTIGPSGANVTGVVTCTSVVSSGAISGTTGTFSGDVTGAGSFVVNADNTDAIKIGASADLLLYHDGSNSKIKNVNTGRLHIENAAGVIRTNTDSGFYIQSADGNTEHARVDSSGANIAGVCTAKTFVPTEGQLSHRNLIINGNMRVAQRGDTTGVQDGYGGCDRFKFVGNSAARATLARTTGTTLNGFGSCQLVNCTTADASLAAGDYHYLGYRFEGQDLYLLKKGTANAESVTLSFWVSSPKTGTHIIQLYDNDNGRHISKSYTVSTADTWEYKTLTFAGDTTGAFDNNADYSLQIYWWLLAGSNFTSGSLATSWSSFTAANAAVGQVNCLDNTSNNFKLTGVQLEVGSVATPFEHRRYGDELATCQRYYQKITGNKIVLMGDYNNSTSNFWGQIDLRTTMRAAPTVTVTAHAGGGTITNYSNPDMLSFNTSTGAAHFDNGTTIEAASEL